jgi:hypothetical protein
MTAVSISMLRGVDGFQLFDTTGTPSGTGIPAIGSFDIGTSAPGAGYDIELRYNTTDQNSAPVLRKDIIIAIRAMQRLLLEAGLQQPAGTYTLPGLGV